MASAKDSGQVRQWKALGHSSASGGQSCGQSLESFSLSFSSNQKQIESGQINQALQEFGPRVLRPILSFATAAGMQREARRRLARALGGNCLTRR